MKTKLLQKKGKMVYAADDIMVYEVDGQQRIVTPSELKQQKKQKEVQAHQSTSEVIQRLEKLPDPLKLCIGVFLFVISAPFLLPVIIFLPFFDRQDAPASREEIERAQLKELEALRSEINELRKQLKR